MGERSIFNYCEGVVDGDWGDRQIHSNVDGADVSELTIAYAVFKAAWVLGFIKWRRRSIEQPLKLIPA